MYILQFCSSDTIEYNIVYKYVVPKLYDNYITSIIKLCNRSIGKVRLTYERDFTNDSGTNDIILLSSLLMILSSLLKEWGYAYDMFIMFNIHVIIPSYPQKYSIISISRIRIFGRQCDSDPIIVPRTEIISFLLFTSLEGIITGKLFVRI